MVEELTIARAEIDPEDLRGTTVAVEPVGKPDQTFIALIEEPLATVNREKVSIIRRYPHGDGYVIRWDILLNGGVDKGLRFPGMLDEAVLRYHTRRNLPQRPMPENAWMFPG